MSDLTNEILIEIRDEIRATRTDLGSRIDQTNSRIDRTNDRLDRLVQEQIRQATAVVELQVGQREMRDEIRGLNARIDNVLTGSVGSAVKEHESRIRRVEEHLGLTGPSK
jgi:chromosome segregation ATPase